MASKTHILLAAVAVLAAAPTFAQAQSNPLLAPPQTPVAHASETECDTLELSVYFSAYESMLSRYAQRAITNAKDELKNCAITKIEATATAEEAHTDEGLGDLSTERAIAVIDALTSSGIDAPQTEYRIASIADDNAHLSSIQARRVDVTVHAAPVHGL